MSGVGIIIVLSAIVGLISNVLLWRGESKRIPTLIMGNAVASTGLATAAFIWDDWLFAGVFLLGAIYMVWSAQEAKSAAEQRTQTH